MNKKITVFIYFSILISLFQINDAKSQIVIYNVNGEYKGILPCSDYESIFYKLVLKDNRTYEETMIFSTNPDDTLYETGNYSVSKNLVNLNKKFPGISLFRYSWGELRVLDMNGNELTGILGEKYILKDNKPFLGEKEVSEVNIPELNREKWSKGIGFYGFGNEPFWSLEIVFGKNIVFESLNDGKLILSGINAKTLDSKTNLYSAESSDEKIVVKYIQNETYDNMSGELFDYELQVDVKFKNKPGTKHYEGWGRFTPDFKLDGEWELVEIDKKKIKPENLQYGSPVLKFDMNKKIFIGSSGCNKLFGKFNCFMGTINSVTVNSTLFPCVNDIETKFISYLKEVMYHSISYDKLNLHTNEGIKLTFIKKDSTIYMKKLNELDNFWILESLNGEKVDKTFYDREIPSLIIDVNKMSYGGYGGCNSYGGSFFAGDKFINFGYAMATQMACKEMKEPQFFEALQNTNSYKIENNKLILMNLSKELMIFRKKE